MNAESNIEVVQATLADDATAGEVEQRLSQIAAALKQKQSEGGGTAKRDLPDGMACPIDPAERALCEGCQ